MEVEDRQVRRVPALAAAKSWPQRPPMVTLCVLVLTSAVSVLGLFHPAVLDALRRDPDALLGGQWWRLLTPLLVQSGGWAQFVSNSVALVIVGVTAERYFGIRRWLILYFAGGLVGEVAGYLWQPHGAGNSIAVLGLAGGLLVLLLYRDSRVSAITSLLVVYWTAALVGYAAGGPGVAVGLCVLLGVPLGLLFKRDGWERLTSLYVEGAVFAGAITLTALGDIHGPAIIAGACAASLMLLWDRSATARTDL